MHTSSFEHWMLYINLRIRFSYPIICLLTADIVGVGPLPCLLGLHAIDMSKLANKFNVDSRENEHQMPPSCLRCQSSHPSWSEHIWICRRSGRCRRWESRKRIGSQIRRKVKDGMIPQRRSSRQWRKREHRRMWIWICAIRFNNRVSTRTHRFSIWYYIFSAYGTSHTPPLTSK